MSLYTKYRPQTFDDVQSQDQAVNYLKNIISENKKSEPIPHAYLFSGTHGVGKTTLARIFARELGVAEVDVYELDAASSSKKIDDMREIIDSTYTMPVMSKYKVYIFDEAHMLTKDSSNAFLKSLEEPPAHVIFMLCTTEEAKIIPTIRSRCNIINLQPATQEGLVARLDYILQNENICFNKNKDKEKELLGIIAKNSSHSFRDSITNLEKIIHSFQPLISTSKLEKENIEEVFGLSDMSLYLGIIDILNNKIDQSEARVHKLLSYVSVNHKAISYASLLQVMRHGMLVRSSVKVDTLGNDEDKFKSYVQSNQDFFTSANMLYFLEKSVLYKSVEDKESALIAITGQLLDRLYNIK